MPHWYNCMECERTFCYSLFEGQKPTCPHCGASETSYEGGEDGEPEEDEGPDA